MRRLGWAAEAGELNGPIAQFADGAFAFASANRLIPTCFNSAIHEANSVVTTNG